MPYPEQQQNNGKWWATLHRCACDVNSLIWPAKHICCDMTVGTAACSAWPTWLGVLGVVHAGHDLPGLGCWGWCMQVMIYLAWGVGGGACCAWSTWLGVLDDLLGCWGAACNVGPTWLGVLDDLLECWGVMPYLAWGVGWLIGVLHAVCDLPGLGCCMQCIAYLPSGVGGPVGVLHAVHDLPGLGCWMT